MINWNYKHENLNINDPSLIPEGDHRVRITKVAEKIFSTGNEGFEITLDVNGHNSKLWYYMVLDPMYPQKTNQRLGMFFDSFAITDYNLSHYDAWVGKDGAVRVKHGGYMGTITAQVAFCLSRKQQDRLPRWQNDNNYVPDDMFDFCNSVQPTTRVERPPMSFDGLEF